MKVLSRISRRAWLLTFVAGSLFLPAFAFAQTDTTPPTLAYTFPTSGAVLQDLPLISGTVTDDVGVARVDVGLLRTSDNTWWNGTAWVPTFTTAPATLNGNNWQRAGDLPGGADLRDDNYVIVAIALDAANNRTQLDINFQIDKTNPASVTFTTPTDNAIIQTLPVVQGNVQDNAGGGGIARVALTLRRNSDGRYWDGTQFVEPETELTTTLDGNFWQRNGGLPSGVNLLDGSYTLRAVAVDRAGNRTASSINFSVDRTAPILTLSSPTDGSIARDFPTISGTAEDATGGGGIDDVRVAIQRTRDNSYWNGTTWVSGFFALSVTRNGTAFSRDNGLPSGDDLEDGVYVVLAQAFDTAGNFSQVQNSVTIDRTAPAVVTFTSPAPAATPVPTPGATPAPVSPPFVKNLSVIAGTASDNEGGVGLEKVNLYLRRQSDGAYWNGSAFVRGQNATPLETELNGNSWSRTRNLPSGALLQNGLYLLTATAIDRAGNSTSANNLVRVLNDDAAPALEFLSPVAGSFLTRIPTITGRVTENRDGSGLDSVGIGILRARDNAFWNGTDFVVGPLVTLPAVITAGNRFELAAFRLPSGDDLSDGTYVLLAVATDRVGNRRQIDNAITIDKTAPDKLVFTRPTAGTNVGTLAPITGVVRDRAGGSGIDRVVLFIKRGSDGFYWNGSSFVPASTALDTVLGDTTAAGTVWTRAGGPAGINLTPGVNYYLSAVGFDRAGNRITTTISVRAIDNIAPTVTINTVLNPAGGTLLGSFTEVSGTLADNPGGSGPARVLLQIRRSSDGFYWNGTAFVEAQSAIPTVLSNGVWTITTGLPPRSALSNGNYILTAIGFDRAGNRDTAVTTVAVFSDSVGPTVTFITPRDGASINSLVRVSGTVVDNDGGSGVARVEVAILRDIDQQWWNGTAFTDTFAALPATLSGNTWTLSTRLPSSANTPRGTYVIIARAFDRVGNRTDEDNVIAIDSNAPPQDVAPTPTPTPTATPASTPALRPSVTVSAASGRVRRPAA